MVQARRTSGRKRGAIRRAAVRLTDVPFAAVIGMLGINNAVTFFAHPGRQAAALLLPPLDYVWIGLYGGGGALILAGVAAAMVNVEAAGCVMYAGGATVSALATAVVNGWSTWNTTLTLLLLAGAALTRVRHLASGRVLVLLAVSDPQAVARRRRGPWRGTRP